jgi:hypothetical protein
MRAAVRAGAAASAALLLLVMAATPKHAVASCFLSDIWWAPWRDVLSAHHACPVLDPPWQRHGLAHPNPHSPDLHPRLTRANAARAAPRRGTPRCGFWVGSFTESHPACSWLSPGPHVGLLAASPFPLASLPPHHRRPVSATCPYLPCCASRFSDLVAYFPFVGYVASARVTQVLRNVQAQTTTSMYM